MRGPIEAPATRLKAGIPCCLPRDQMRGPIEAREPQATHSAQEILPRDQMRGPIEAGNSIGRTLVLLRPSARSNARSH